MGTRAQEASAADLNEIVRTVLLNLRVAIEESKAQVEHGVLPTVIADAGQMMQLFQNLIGNAIKFRGEEAPQVRIEAVRIDEAWQFTVRDNGIGIDPQHHDRIFVIFQRLHTRETYPGTGIGLAVCRKIVERHGGRLWIKSQPGQGASFHFTLPDSKQIEQSEQST